MTCRTSGIGVAVLVLLTPVRAQNSTKWTPDDTLKVKRVGPVVPSPDGSRVAFVAAAGTVDAKRAPTAPWKTPQPRVPQLPQTSA